VIVPAADRTACVPRSCPASQRQMPRAGRWSAVTKWWGCANVLRVATERQKELDRLLVAARTSADAFAGFYRRCERPLLGFFMSQTGRADLATDLTAETFARALEDVEAFDPGRGHGDQWLFGIARHVWGDSLRRGRVESAARVRLGLPDTVLSDHAAEVISRLSASTSPASAALAELPESQHTAVLARVIGERGYPEIATDLECSEALVRQNVSRGLRTMRRRLGGRK
jgi:RNA polymerase sigma factor (sigma-70 family)